MIIASFQSTIPPRAPLWSTCSTTDHWQSKALWWTEVQKPKRSWRYTQNSSESRHPNAASRRLITCRSLNAVTSAGHSQRRSVQPPTDPHVAPHGAAEQHPTAILVFTMLHSPDLAYIQAHHLVSSQAAGSLCGAHWQAAATRDGYDAAVQLRGKQWPLAIHPCPLRHSLI